jgi:hypothetical protein
MTQKESVSNDPPEGLRIGGVCKECLYKDSELEILMSKFQVLLEENDQLK